MKFTKTSLAIMAVAGLLSLSSQAQTNTPPGGRQGGGGGQGGGGQRRSPEQQMTQLSEQLQLTDAQKPKVKAVLDEQTKKMQELRADTGASREDRRAKLQVIQEDSSKKMKEILTPEQFKKFQEQQQQMRARRNGAGGGAGAPGGGGGQNRNAGGNAQQ